MGLNSNTARPVGSVTLGVLFMAMAFLCFASMDTIAKWLVVAAVPALQVAFVRYFFHFSWVLLLYWRPGSKGHAISHSKQPKLQFTRAVLLLASTAFNFSALKFLPLTTCIAIFFAMPMVVCLLSIPVLGEKVGIRRFMAIAFGFLGVLVIVQPWGEAFDPHIFLSLCALMSASGYFVLSRKIAGIDHNSVSQFYAAGVATLVLSPFAFSMWVWPTEYLQWGLFVLIGSLGMLGHSLLTKAHDFAEASVLAPMVYTQIIYITVLGWLVFGTIPGANTAIGVTIIVASGLYIWLREKTLNDGVATIPVRHNTVDLTTPQDERLP